MFILTSPLPTTECSLLKDTSVHRRSEVLCDVETKGVVFESHRAAFQISWLTPENADSMRLFLDLEDAIQVCLEVRVESDSTCIQILKLF